MMIVSTLVSASASRHISAATRRCQRCSWDFSPVDSTITSAPNRSRSRRVICWLQRNLEAGPTLPVAAAQHGAVAIQPGEAGAVAGVQIELDHPGRAGEAAIELGQQAIQPLAGTRRAEHHLGQARRGLGHARRVVRRQQVDLVPQLQQAPLVDQVVQPEIAQHLKHVGALRRALGMGDVAHMDHQIGDAHLLERGAERGDQIGRQLRDEADGIGQDRVAARRQGKQPHGRVEGREQLVAGPDRGPGQAVEQGRFAGIGVADQRDHRIGHAPARLAVQPAGPLDRLELALDAIDALVDPTAVELDLGFARAADEAERAALALQVGPGADQARALIGERRQLDLQAAFVAVAPGRRRSPGSARCDRSPCTSRHAPGCAAAPG